MTVGTTLVARLLLALVFGLSAVSKLAAPGIFRQDVAAYHLLPALLVDPFAVALPWIEALLALYVLIGLFLRPTAVALAALLSMFIVVLTYSIAIGNVQHDCGCFTAAGTLAGLPIITWLAGGSTIGVFDVLRDVVFLVLTGAIYWGDRSTLSVDGLLFGHSPEPEIIGET